MDIYTYIYMALYPLVSAAYLAATLLPWTIYIYTYTHTHISIYVSIYIHVYMYICIYILAATLLPLHSWYEHIQIYIYTYMCKYIYTFIYIWPFWLLLSSAYLAAAPLRWHFLTICTYIHLQIYILYTCTKIYVYTNIYMARYQSRSAAYLAALLLV